jgi:hypothetical protein
VIGALGRPLSSLGAFLFMHGPLRMSLNPGFPRMGAALARHGLHSRSEFSAMAARFPQYDELDLPKVADEVLKQWEAEDTFGKSPTDCPASTT